MHAGGDVAQILPLVLRVLRLAQVGDHVARRTLHLAVRCALRVGHLAQDARAGRRVAQVVEQLPVLRRPVGETRAEVVPRVGVGIHRRADVEPRGARRVDLRHHRGGLAPVPATRREPRFRRRADPVQRIAGTAGQCVSRCSYL